MLDILAIGLIYYYSCREEFTRREIISFILVTLFMCLFYLVCAILDTFGSYGVVVIIDRQ